MALRSVRRRQWEAHVSLRFYASAKEQRPPLKSVQGPQGDPLFLCDLPSADHKRWTVRNKLEVVAAVRGGLLSLTEACSRYRMSVEEFRTWEKEAGERRQIMSRPMIRRIGQGQTRDALTLPSGIDWVWPMVRRGSDASSR